MNKESKKINDEEIDEIENAEEEFDSLSKLYLISCAVIVLIVLGIVIYNMRQIIFDNLISFIICSFFILILISVGIYYLSLPFMEEKGKPNIFNYLVIIAKKIPAILFSLFFIAFGSFAGYAAIAAAKENIQSLSFIPFGILFILAGIYIIITKVLPKKPKKINKRKKKNEEEIVYVDNRTIDLVNKNSNDEE